MVKPARGLTKQKATTQLQKFTTTRVTRRSAEQKNELMEQDEVIILFT